MQSPAPGGRLTGKQKFLLSLPVPAASLSSVLIHNVYIKLYTDIIGLEPVWVGLVYLIYNIWNFINDPLIGVWIDRRPYDPKRGKFLYLMRVSVPFMLLCLVAMLLSQPSWPQALIFAALLVELFIFDTFSTTYLIATQSYVLLAAPTKEERVDVNVAQSYVANVVSFVATLVPTFLLVGNREGDRGMIVLILLGVVAFNAGIYALALFKLEDKASFYSAGDQEGGLNLKSLRQDTRELFRMKSFRSWAVYNLLALAPNAVYFTAFLYLMDHVIRSGGFEATLADTLPMLVVFAFLPLIGKYVKQKGGRRAIFVGSLPYALGHLALFFTGSWVSVLLCYIPIMMGKYMMGTGGAPLSAALIDENERLTGTRKTGLITSLLALIAAPAISTQLMIYMGILQLFGCDATAKVQSAQAMLGIRVGTALVPIAFLAVGLIPLIFFPIDRAKEEELSRFSEQRRRGQPEE